MSSDAELVKASLDAAFGPVKDIANRLFGPVADQLGAVLANPMRVFQFQQSVRLLQKVKRICAEAGIDPKAVPLKTLLPILENASVEQEEDLHDRWANLLAHAGGSDDVHPAFPDILRHLSGSDVKFLDALCETPVSHLDSVVSTSVPADERLMWNDLRELWDQRIGSGTDFDFAVSLDNLLRLNLLTRSIRSTDEPKQYSSGAGVLPAIDFFAVTSLGFRFVLVCRTPKKKGDLGGAAVT